MTSVVSSSLSRARTLAVRLVVASVICALAVAAPNAPRAAASGGSTVDWAVTFAGGTQSATAPDSGSVYDGLGSFTFAAWVRPNSGCSTSFCMIVNKEDSWELAINSGVLDFAVMGATQNWDWQSNRAAASTLPRIAVGTWSHVVMSVDRAGNDLYLFVNGQLVYSLLDSTVSVPSTGRDATEVLTISGRPGANQATGSIDEVRYYNVARNTAAQAQADMGTWGPASTANLMAYFDFNEGTGTALGNDATAAGAGPGLTLNGSPTWVDVKTVDTSTAQGETIVQFPRTYLTQAGGYTIPNGVTRMRVLVVGGGGGGAARHGGGGGGGGVTSSSDYSVTAGNIFEVTVGVGGQGGAGGANNYGIAGSAGTQSQLWRNGAGLRAFGGRGGERGTSPILQGGTSGGTGSTSLNLAGGTGLTGACPSGRSTWCGGGGGG
ncbi:MAG: LamG domain-containing protein, partial [Actinomycetales bacterium]